MDPNATWAFMLKALKEEQWDDALDCAEALRDWLQSGGFPPEFILSGKDTDNPYVLNTRLAHTVALAACTEVYDQCLGYLGLES